MGGVSLLPASLNLPMKRGLALRGNSGVLYFLWIPAKAGMTLVAVSVFLDQG